MKVELLPAFWWICRVCGNEHFERAIRAELTPEDRAAMDAEGVGEMLAAPDTVRCDPGCGAEYDTEYAGEEVEP